MKFIKYSKYTGEDMGVDAQDLLKALADFLLQSGFAGGNDQPYYGGWDMGDDGNKSLDALKQAILDALMESGQFTPEMLEALRGGEDEEGQAKLAQLLDQLIQRLIEEGYLNVENAPQMPAGHQAVTGPGGLAKAAARDVNFNLTDKGIDFLGYKTLRNLLG